MTLSSQIQTKLDESATRRAILGDAAAAELSPEEESRLRALGYGN